MGIAGLGRLAGGLGSVGQGGDLALAASVRRRHHPRGWLAPGPARVRERYFRWDEGRGYSFAVYEGNFPDLQTLRRGLRRRTRRPTWPPCSPGRSRSSRSARSRCRSRRPSPVMKAGFGRHGRRRQALLRLDSGLTPVKFCDEARIARLVANSLTCRPAASPPPSTMPIPAFEDTVIRDFVPLLRRTPGKPTSYPCSPDPTEIRLELTTSA